FAHAVDAFVRVYSREEPILPDRADSVSLNRCDLHKSRFRGLLRGCDSQENGSMRRDQCLITVVRSVHITVLPQVAHTLDVFQSDVGPAKTYVLLHVVAAVEHRHGDSVAL